MQLATAVKPRRVLSICSGLLVFTVLLASACGAPAAVRSSNAPNVPPEATATPSPETPLVVHFANSACLWDSPDRTDSAACVGRRPAGSRVQIEQVEGRRLYVLDLDPPAGRVPNYAYADPADLDLRPGATLHGKALASNTRNVVACVSRVPSYAYTRQTLDALARMVGTRSRPGDTFALLWADSGVPAQAREILPLVRVPLAAPERLLGIPSEAPTPTPLESPNPFSVAERRTATAAALAAAVAATSAADSRATLVAKATAQRQADLSGPAQYAAERADAIAAVAVTSVANLDLGACITRAADLLAIAEGTKILVVAAPNDALPPPSASLSLHRVNIWVVEFTCPVGGGDACARVQTAWSSFGAAADTLGDPQFLDPSGDIADVLK